MSDHSDESSIKDIAAVTIICFGMFIGTSINAVLNGFPSAAFTNASFYSLIVTECILGMLACLYLRSRNFNMTNLVPAPTAEGTIIGGVLILLCYGLCCALEFFIGSTIEQPVDAMVENSEISIIPLVAGSVVNGIYEEIFLLGYIQRFFQKRGVVFAVGVSCLIRVLYHLYQGPAGAADVLVIGIIFGLYFYLSQKLWPIVFAHTIVDVLAFVIYGR